MKILVNGKEQGTATQATIISALETSQELIREAKDLNDQVLTELQKLRVHNEIITGDIVKEEDV